MKKQNIGAGFRDVDRTGSPDLFVNLFKTRGLRELSLAPMTLIVTDYTLANEVFQLLRNADEAREAGVVTAGEVAKWAEDLERSSENGQFFSAVTGGFVVSGRKP